MLGKEFTKKPLPDTLEDDSRAINQQNPSVIETEVLQAEKLFEIIVKSPAIISTPKNVTENAYDGFLKNPQESVSDLFPLTKSPYTNEYEPTHSVFAKVTTPLKRQNYSVTLVNPFFQNHFLESKEENRLGRVKNEMTRFSGKDKRKAMTKDSAMDNENILVKVASINISKGSKAYTITKFRTKDGSQHLQLQPREFDPDLGKYINVGKPLTEISSEVINIESFDSVTEKVSRHILRV